MMVRYEVIDYETNILNTGDEAVGKMKAAPWHPSNKVVYSGVKSFENTEVAIGKHVFGVDPAMMLVGHNLKFDIHYAMMSHPAHSIHSFMFKGKIWDTQLAEYIITGQRSTYATLDSCSEKYGGVLKDDRLKKDYWNNGIDTADIPEEIVIPYLKNDVLNTELVFLCQYAAVKKLGIMPLIESQMRALKATIEMEYNGMHFDRKLAENIKNSLLPVLRDRVKEVRDIMESYDIVEPNPASNADLGLLLFGGESKYMMPVAQLDAKTGMPKLFKTGPRKGMVVTKNEPYSRTVIGIFEGQGEKTASGKWAVGDSILKDLKHPVLDKIKEMRSLSKDISTYYEGYSNLTWGVTEIIHHSLNHCNTATGRLSCTSPNLQNTTTED
jgi:DNA polymerase-1